MCDGIKKIFKINSSFGKKHFWTQIKEKKKTKNKKSQKQKNKKQEFKSNLGGFPFLNYPPI